MANYHLSVENLCRKKGDVITSYASYILRSKLYDIYYGETRCCYKKDLLYSKIILPDNAPTEFFDYENLCFAIEKAETRKNARIARTFIGSLPNELSLNEQIKIVEKFIDENFTKKGLGAIAAIHEGKNEADPSKNNPHVHIVVTTRTIEPDGFCKKKYREWNKKEYIKIWRKHWAKLQNKSYEKNHIKAKVSPYSLKAQGCKRKALPHISITDYQKEKRGIRTEAGDKKRKIQKENQKIKKRYKEFSNDYDMDI